MFVDFTKLNRLPSLPAVAVQLLAKFSDPDVALSVIVQIIQRDPAITAKLMRAANSALYGVGRPVTDLTRAVNLLGKKTVTSLSLCFSLTEESMRSGPFSKLYRDVWMQSILQATAAEVIARRYDRGMEGEYFAAALLADIGRLAMLKSAPQEYAAIVERVGREQADVEDCEDEVFGINHTSLSTALLEHWKLPARFAAAVRRRHMGPQQLKEVPTGEERRLSQAVALSTSVGAYFCHGSKGLALIRIAELGEELYEMTADDVREFLDVVQNRVSAAADLFDADLSGIGSPTELMSEAMEQLSRLATAADEGTADEEIRNQLLDENGQLKQRIQDLVRRNTVDPLTGVFNRGHFDEQLTEQSAVARAGRHPLGLLFIDADHFKKINDTYGHAVGDLVLKRMATVLMRTIRGNDLVARYGGEEFVVLVANPSAVALQSLGERIRDAIEKERIAVEKGAIRATVSIGGALLEPPHENDATSRLLAAADAALYAAKGAGRNRVEVRVCERRPLVTTSPDDPA